MASAFINFGGKNPDVLITSINQQLNTAAPKEGLTYKEIAHVDSSSPGVFAEYVMRVCSVKERLMGPTQERNFTDVETCSVVVKASRIDGPAELYPLDDLFDLYGVLKDQSYDMIRQSQKIWDRLLAQAINDNGASFDYKSYYDNSPFFGVHSTNPGRIGAPTFNNDIAAPSDETGFLLAWKTMQAFVGFDGTYINADMGTPIILCPTVEVKLAFDKLINEGIIAKQVAGAAASETTQLVGWARTVLMPELVDASNPITLKRWYLLNTRHSTRRAFIVRTYKQPKFILTGPGDSFAHRNSARALYYEATGGAGFGLPQLAVRCTTP